MPVSFRNVMIMYIVFCVFVIVRGLMSSNPLIPLTRAASMISIMIMVTCFFLDVDNMQKLRDVLLGIVLSVDIIIIYCFLFHFNGLSFDLNYEENLLGNKNTLGNYLFLAAVSCIFLIETRNNKFWNVFLYTNLIVIIVSILMSLSFKIMIATSLCLGVFVIRKIIVEKKRGVALVAVAAVILLAPFAVDFLDSEGGSILRDRFYVLIGQEDKAVVKVGYLDEREELSQQTYHLFKENPIFGVGLEVTRDIFEIYSHNTFMEILAGGGIILMIPFALMLWYFWLPIWKRRNFVVISSFISVIFIANGIKIYDTHPIMLVLFIALFYSLLQPEDVLTSKHRLVIKES